MHILSKILSASTFLDFLAFTSICTLGLFVEHFFPRFKYDDSFEPLWKRVRRNVTLGIFYRLLVLPIVLVPILAAASKANIWSRPEFMNSSWFILMDFLILDFLNYASHFFFHKNQYLWRFHMTHHLEQHLDMSTNFRTHFVEKAITALIRSFGIVVFAIPVKTVILWQGVSFFIGLYHHNNIRFGQDFETKWLNKLFNTRAFHDIHHGRDRKYNDSNYAYMFTIWDYLFGTYSTNIRPANFSNGIEGYQDYSAIELLTNPFTGKDYARPQTSIVIEAKQ